ncbi:MAG: hypothetical protein AB7E72_16415 [Lysobacterales bacterium]
MLRLQWIMLVTAALAWLGMLARALAVPMARPFLDDLGLYVALGGLVGFLGAWTIAAFFSRDDSQLLLTAVNDEHATHFRQKAEVFGFRAVLVYLLATQLLADSRIFDLGVGATTQLGLLLGLVCALGAFVWAQRR